MIPEKDLESAAKWCREKDKFHDLVKAIEAYLSEQKVGFEPSEDHSDPFGDEHQAFVNDMEDVPQ
jgi:hypothetical protein